MSAFQARAQYDFIAGNPDEISFSQGQILTVISEEERGWYLGEYSDDAGLVRIGMLPSTFVERYQPASIPSDTSLQPGPSRDPPYGYGLWHTSMMAAIESLNERSRVAAGSEENTTLHVRLPASVEHEAELASDKSGADGQNEAVVLFEDDEALKSFYRNLDLDSKTADGSGQSSGESHPQRDSGIGLQVVEVSSSYAASDTNNTDRVTSLSRLSHNPIRALRTLQVDLGFPELPNITALDPRDPGFFTEVTGLESIINSSVERKEIPPSPLQLNLITRLQRLVVSVETADGNDSSQTFTELNRKFTSLANRLVQLLDPTRSCVVCGNEEPASKYGPKITANCAHDTNTCKTCLQMWILSQLAEKRWDKIICSECPELFQHSDVQEHVNEKVFQRYIDYF
jgi:hypothetical protein